MKKLFFFPDFEKFSKKISDFFRSQKNFFSELKKKVGYSFDVKNWDLSIAGVFRAIRAILLPEKLYFFACISSKNRILGINLVAILPIVDAGKLRSVFWSRGAIFKKLVRSL